MRRKYKPGPARLQESGHYTLPRRRLPSRPAKLRTLCGKHCRLFRASSDPSSSLTRHRGLRILLRSSHQTQQVVCEIDQFGSRFCHGAYVSMARRILEKPDGSFEQMANGFMLRLRAETATAHAHAASGPFSMNPCEAAQCLSVIRYPSDC
jgi:hypothetical protein